MSNVSFDMAVASIAVPTIDVSVLTSAPQAALMLRSLSILAACAMDASLENNKTAGMIKLLKTPGSFRGSLYQTSASMSDAFRTADQAMLRIKINLDDIPLVMTSLVEAYAKPEDLGSTFIGNLRMKDFQSIAKICTDESVKARQKFDDTVHLIEELIQVTTATVGDNEEKMKEANASLALYNAERKALEEQRETLKSRIAAQKVRIQEFSVKYDKATEKMTDTFTVVVSSLADTLKDVSGFFSLGRAAAVFTSSEHNQSSIGDDNANNGSDAKLSKKRIGNAIDGASSVASKVATTAIGSYQEAARLAKEMHIYYSNLEQLTLQEDAVNRMAIARIAAKMTNGRVDHVNFNDTILYLSSGLKILGQVQQQWGVIQHFFATLESAIIGPMARHLMNFDDIVKQEHLRESGILRNQLAITGLRAAAICTSVAREATVYNKVSQKYVLPKLYTSVGQISMSKAEALEKLPKIADNMEQDTHEVHAFIQEELAKAQNITAGQMIAVKDAFQKVLNGTVLALSPKTQGMVNEGNALMAEFNQQGLALHDITFKQKAVGAKIEDIIAKFAAHEVMRFPKTTITALQDVKSSFEVIRSNINGLESKEKEMSSLIQNIITRQQHGNAESDQVNAQLVITQNTLDSIQEQINVTQSNLNTMAAELERLQKNIADVERKIAERERSRWGWLIGAIFTFGILTFAAVGAFESAAKNERGHRQQLRANAEANFRNLKKSFQQNMAQKANLENDQRQRQFELGQIAEILNRLQPSLQDTSKYRQYLLKLSDAFTQVNSYVQNLEKNLGTVEQVQAAGHSPDGSMNITISTDYKNLGNAWTSAKEQPVVQMALNLQDPNNPGATLGAIKALNLAGRKKRSLEQDKEIFSWLKSLQLKSRAANVYIEVSKKYVLPQIDSSAVIILNREDAKDKLPGMEANMEQVTKEVHAFVEQKLVEMRRTTVEQMTAIRNGFQKAMNGTLHALPHLTNSH